MKDEMYVLLAWMLPRGLVYWCAVRVLNAATLDKWGDTPVGDIRAVSALERWENV